MSFYGGYSEANRAPTASEIACSDPNNPCIIESALASDPHLNQVVTRTWELGPPRAGRFHGAGVRGGDWSVGWFRALNDDDIIQVADQQQGRGYFANAGETQTAGHRRKHFRIATNAGLATPAIPMSMRLSNPPTSSRRKTIQDQYPLPSRRTRTRMKTIYPCA